MVDAPRPEMPRPELVLTGDDPNGVARLLHTVLGEKLDESPWKAGAARSLSSRTIRLSVPDRGESAEVAIAARSIDIRSERTGRADVEVDLDMQTLPLLLGIPLVRPPWRRAPAPARLPALWRTGGTRLLRGLVARQVRIRGALAHPVVVVRVLQMLGVPPGTVG